MASELIVQTLKGPTSGANANKIIVPAGQTLDASGGTFVPSSGGVIQVKQGIKADRQAISSTSWTDITGLSVSITPTSANSKILVRLSVNAAGNNNCYITLVSSQSSNMIGSTISALGATSGNRNPSLHDYYYGGGGWTGFVIHTGVEILDSPATTSQITYGARAFTGTSNDTIRINESIDGEDSIYRAAMLSTITVMEIAG